MSDIHETQEPSRNPTEDDTRGPVSMHDVVKQDWKDFKKLASIMELPLSDAFSRLVRDEFKRQGLPRASSSRE